MNIKETLDIILQDRASSWPILISAYLVLTIIIRRFTFSQLRISVKCTDKDVYKQAKKGYFKDSLTGWLFYLISIGFLLGFWFSENISFLNKVPHAVYLSGFFLFFLFSLLSHIRSFFFSTVHAFHEKVEELEYEDEDEEED